MIPLRQLMQRSSASARTFPSRFRRSYANLNRPSPFALPREDQREFEELQRTAQVASDEDMGFELHPDARVPVKPEFEGEVNPKTGEEGGPKQEPVRHWAEGDWSFKGRVSDF